MAAYFRFDPSDIIHYDLHTSPRVVAASGSSGWRANTGPSGSISMYGGIRGRESTGDFDIKYTFKIPTYSIDGELDISGSYPTTGSLTYVKCRDKEYVEAIFEEHDSLWGGQHFAAINNLYSWYSRVNCDYTTGSYDYYALYSEDASSNKVTVSGSELDNMTSSYTVEAMIKPFTISGNATVVSRTGTWKLFVNAAGNVAFSASDGSAIIRSSSLSLTNNRWQHIAYSVNNGTGSFFINMVDAGQVVGVTGALDTPGSTIPMNVAYDEQKSGESFHGFLHDIKLWSTGRTFSQLSSSFSRTMVESGSSDLVSYLRFNDGPKMTTHGMVAGSGAFDYSNYANHGLLQNFNSRVAPIWHPNDNPNFTTIKKLIPNSIDEFMVVHIPSMFYGRQIATGSVKLVCNAFTNSGLRRTLVDDGRGGLYLSGSAVTASLDSQESYQGVKWNKVGNVFYSEGLIVIKDPALLDFAMEHYAAAMQDDLLQVSFRGINIIPTKVFMCRINGAEANASNNPTFSTFDSGSGKFRVIRDEPTTYITSVGLYDENYELVAVAKLADPVRNREKDKLNIRLKMDF